MKTNREGLSLPDALFNRVITNEDIHHIMLLRLPSLFILCAVTGNIKIKVIIFKADWDF